MEEIDHHFAKNERLYKKKEVEMLFQKGASFIAYPIRVQFLFVPELTESTPSSSCSLFSVPKKRFKRAVKRNLLRRRMREAFRLQKHQIKEFVPSSWALHCAFIYLDKSIQDYALIESAFQKIIKRLKAKSDEHFNQSNT